MWFLSRITAQKIFSIYFRIIEAKKEPKSFDYETFVAQEWIFLYQVVIEKSIEKQKMKKVELPSIDISSLIGDGDRKRRVSDELIETFEETGFAALV